jgi:ABC-type antimicrobial peptide transport system permease subunit
MLESRGAFVFTETIEGSEAGDAWSLLDLDLGPAVVPAVGDYASVYWALGKSIGDDIEFSDEKGRPFRVRIVGMLKNSILQGSLIISEKQFVGRYPSEEGYRVLLVDAPVDKADAVMDEFSLRMMDYGLSISSTKQRLAEFGAVQNTYLSMFQTLGGLSLVLGSIGLGLVVLRNLLERRGELAMLRAVGFDKVALKKMVLYEHFGLMLAGLACGLISAIVAVSPAIRAPGSDVPYLSLLAITVIIAASGLLWIWLASALALRSGMLDALRNE